MNPRKFHRVLTPSITRRLNAHTDSINARSRYRRMRKKELMKFINFKEKYASVICLLCNNDDVKFTNNTDICDLCVSNLRCQHMEGCVEEGNDLSKYSKRCTGKCSRCELCFEVFNITINGKCKSCLCKKLRHKFKRIQCCGKSFNGTRCTRTIKHWRKQETFDLIDKIENYLSTSDTTSFLVCENCKSWRFSGNINLIDDFFENYLNYEKNKIKIKTKKRIYNSYYILLLFILFN